MEDTRGTSFGKDLTERPRATTQAALTPQPFSPQALGDEQVGIVADAAKRAGMLAAGAAAVASGGVVAAANAFSPRFRGALGVSGKAALVVTPSAGAFYLKSHLTMAHARANPEAFLHSQRAMAGGRGIGAAEQGSLALWQSAANMVYDHPFKTIIGIAVPCYLAIFHRESTNPATAQMLLSQRLIHTRVYGQGVVVLTAIAVMGFAESMRRDGRYRVEDGAVVRGDPSSRMRHWYSAESEEAAERIRLSEERRLSDEYDARRGKGYDLLVPLLYAPVIPLLRIQLRGKVPPERLTQLVGGVVAIALSHAGYIMFSDSTVRGADEPES